MPQFNGEDVLWFNTKNVTIHDILNHIETENPDLVIIYAELIITGSKRSEYKGIELIKHIRLTPLNNDNQNIPIVFLHWLPIDAYIGEEIENLFLYSPCILRVRLPINNTIFEIPQKLTENIKQFIFNSEKDEKISEHQFRNEIAISQFEDDSIGNTKIKEKPLWFKKLYYQQGYSDSNVSIPVKPILLKYKILLIDDMGEKWKHAILKVIPNAEITLCKSISDSKSIIARLKDLIITRRANFTDKLQKISFLAAEIEREKEELIIISNKLNNSISLISTSQNSITNEQKNISNKTYQLLELLKDLNENNGLFEALISFKTDSLNAKSKQEVTNLSAYITSIINSKEKIEEFENKIKQNKTQNESDTKRKEEIEQELSQNKTTYKNISNEIDTLFELLIENQFDLTFLDMHLCKESEGQEPTKMDGFQILTEMSQANLKLPVVIFSATKRDVSNLKKTFRFIKEEQFIKGITPVSILTSFINNLQFESDIKRLINIIDEVIAFPIFKYREYEVYDNKLYITGTITQQNRTEIVSKLNTIKIDLDTYLTNKNISHLKSIVLTLGNILREYRLRVNKSVVDRQNSLFHHRNTEKNGISPQCTDLIFWRNKNEHVPTDNNEKTLYEEWCNKLDLKEVEKHLKTVYRGLIFDE